MQFEERLEVPVALELANVFLRFSNKQQASYAERGRLVQDSRYCAEAAAMAKAIMDRGECGRAQQILAWCKALQGDHGAAAGDFCAALPNLTQDPATLRTWPVTVHLWCLGSPIWWPWWRRPSPWPSSPRPGQRQR
ncbi:unnamed protein product [Effrenium voratum]|nr:unnamed protein product [Effrenium voratum]